MAPSGLVISKLGVQATATDDHVIGLLCFKISLPRESEGRPGARWALFASQPPKLISEPTIHPLPLALPTRPHSHSDDKRQTKHLHTASTLLSLPTSSSYPPTSPSGLGSKPYIDVSSTTGKVFVVVDPISGGRKGHRSSPSNSAGASSSSTSRKDWLVCIEFEVPIDVTVEQTVSQVLLPLPRCLDNVIRFYINSYPPSSSKHTGDIDILAEPKVLLLPPSAFQRPRLRLQQRPARQRRMSSTSARGRRKRAGDTSMEGDPGWEDGEDYGPDGALSGSEEESQTEVSETEEESEEGGGSWLQGRFQSTDVLRLQWSLATMTGPDDIPLLQVTPHWDRIRPSIDVIYTAHLDNDQLTSQSQLSLDVMVPEGWGWSHLSITGDGVTSWRSVDGDWWQPSIPHETDPDATLDPDLPEYEDSFSTIRAKRQRPTPPAKDMNVNVKRDTYQPSQSSSTASLMRQTLPTPANMKLEDFSFEGGSMESLDSPTTHSQSKATAPASMRSMRTPHAPMLVDSVDKAPPQPKPGRRFDLDLALSPSDVGEITVRGILVPLTSSTLVSTALPVPIPFARLDSQEQDAQQQQCFVTCPGARLSIPNSDSNSNESTLSAGADRQLCDVGSGGSFLWLDEGGRPFPPSMTTAVVGPIQIRLRRNVWGVMTMHVLFSWPRRTDELGFTIASVKEARIIKATAAATDVPIPRAAYESDGKLDVRLGKKDLREGNKVEVVLELSSEDVLGLPVFEGGKGRMDVELIGSDWEDLLEKGIKTNITRSAPTSFTYDLSSPLSASPSITLSSASKAHLEPVGKNRDSTRAEGNSRNTNTLAGWVKRAICSPATMVNLLMIWIMISTVQKVDILRREVAFVVDETRDLRMYGYSQPQHQNGPKITTMDETTQPIPSGPDSGSTDSDHLVTDAALTTDHALTLSAVEQNTDTDAETLANTIEICGHGHGQKSEDVVVVAREEHYPLGRVVFGQAGWERWAAHPTVRTISHGIAWLWHTVVWLIHP